MGETIYIGKGRELEDSVLRLVTFVPLRAQFRLRKIDVGSCSLWNGENIRCIRQSEMRWNEGKIVSP